MDNGVANQQQRVARIVERNELQDTIARLQQEIESLKAQPIASKVAPNERFPIFM